MANSNSVRLFTWKDLSLLNSKSNAHVAYRQKVYNVSSFVSKHPGGMDQIMSGAGHDITQLFNIYHKRDTFEKVLKKYYVGELVDNELPVFMNKSSELYDTIRDRVEQYAQFHKIDPKYDVGMFVIYFISLLLYLSSWFFTMYFCGVPLFYIPFAAAWGLLTTIIGNTLFHDSSHYSITHKPWVWKLSSVVSTVITGISMYTWHYQHVHGHHSYTNIEGADPDIDTGPKESDGIWRIKSSQRWINKFLYQHIYMPFLYTLLGIKMRIQDFPDVFMLKKDDIRMNPLTVWQWLEFWFIKISHVTIRFIIPFLFMPLIDFVVATLVFELVCSLSFAQITQLNHVTSEVNWVKCNQDKKIHDDWTKLQIASTQDYCTDSLFWTIFTGSLNHQVAHHLFPGYLQSHYRWITPIVRKTCAEYGVKYNCADSFLECLGLHYRYLRKMGHHLDR